MNDYLMRDAAPFSDEVWAQIDAMVVNVLQSSLVGRRFIDMVGPLGWGVETAPQMGFDVLNGAVVATDTTYIPLEEIGEEALIKAKQLAMAAQTPFALDLGAVAIAAVQVAHAEDSMILDKLLAAGSTNTLGLGDWNTFGAPFGAVAAATAKLQNDGFDAPYALVLNPAKYAQLAGLMQQGRKELEMVERLVKGGIFQSPLMPMDKVMVLSPKGWNFDMVVGQDAATAYVGNEGLDHRLRIFETVALRVKMAGSICVLA